MFFIFMIQRSENLISVGLSFLWARCSKAGYWILHRIFFYQNFIGYYPRKVYLKILHCRLWRISTNALIHVVRKVRKYNKFHSQEVDFEKKWCQINHVFDAQLQVCKVEKKFCQIIIFVYSSMLYFSEFSEMGSGHPLMAERLTGHNRKFK